VILQSLVTQPLPQLTLQWRDATISHAMNIAANRLPVGGRDDCY
jgi:hypothetical protein